MKEHYYIVFFRTDLPWFGFIYKRFVRTIKLIQNNGQSDKDFFSSVLDSIKEKAYEIADEEVEITGICKIS